MQKLKDYRLIKIIQKFVKKKFDKKFIKSFIKKNSLKKFVKKNLSKRIAKQNNTKNSAMGKMTSIIRKKSDKTQFLEASMVHKWTASLLEFATISEFKKRIFCAETMPSFSWSIQIISRLIIYITATYNSS